MPYQRQVSRPMRQTERKHLYKPQGKATFKTSMGYVPESDSGGMFLAPPLERDVNINPMFDLNDYSKMMMSEHAPKLPPETEPPIIKQDCNSCRFADYEGEFCYYAALHPTQAFKSRTEIPAAVAIKTCLGYEQRKAK